MKNVISPFAIALAVTAATGCSNGDEAATADSEVARSVPASHCEVFVDRALPSLGSHGSKSVTLYLKTPAGKLDAHGGVAAVGLHAKEILGTHSTTFRDYPARAFVGSSDYWEIYLNVDTGVAGTRVYRGAFYVEAKDGARLWLNAREGDRNFVLDPNLVTDLTNRRAPGFFAAGAHADVQSAVVTADELPYLNPDKCR
jgi:hypothetical protein